jgi:UDP-N-acetylglucosamine/UDP-N-acetylgalactosamine diphosphorylase
MAGVPEELRARLRRYGQEHVLAWWDHLSAEEQSGLLEQLGGLDLDLLQRLYTGKSEPLPVPAADRIAPPPVARLDPQDQETRGLGESALRNGEVAVLIVAGGQGSRLGSDEPKGMFPVGPVSGKSLFQLHAEKVLALQRRYQRPIPLLIMTSPATHQATTAYFAEHGYFGLSADNVYFFCQGTMAALELGTGKLIMESPGRLFLSPNGHGGVLAGLVQTGLLDRLQGLGITQIFYLQVDNALVKIGDPLFLGYHLRAKAEASSKAVAKLDPADKLGNFASVDGRCFIIEYSDLPEDLAREKDSSGRLRFWAGSPAIHIFSTDFLLRVSRGGTGLPYHRARKKVPYLDEHGDHVNPDKENAVKFEMFIFDVLPLADRWTVVETDRGSEFVPLKNPEGPESPAAVRQALGNLAASWLEFAGVSVPRTKNGDAAVPLEISPAFALDAQELADRLRGRRLNIEQLHYLDEAKGQELRL